MEHQESVQRRFELALETFLEKVQRDDKILAALLFGSMSYDQVWEQSDIDIYLVGVDEKQPTKSYCLVEHGVNIHAVLYPRGQFKKMMDGSLQGSFFHSSFSRSKLLFSRDDTLREFYENVNHVGSRDREVQLLRFASNVLYQLAKAEKWHYVKHDVEYTTVWILGMVDDLAKIELIEHGEVPGREVIQHALRLNPAFFNTVYTNLIHGEKNTEVIQKTLDAIHAYLDMRIHRIFKPILDYLKASQGVRSTTELDDYFEKRLPTSFLLLAYEWLAHKGVIQKLSVPVRLTEKSRVDMEEAAYYYDGEDFA